MRRKLDKTLCWAEINQEEEPDIEKVAYHKQAMPNLRIPKTMEGDESMEKEKQEIHHYIWVKNDKDNDRHYTACCSHELPSVFVSKHGRKYAYIAFDTLSMYGGDLKRASKQRKTSAKTMQLYKGYAKTFGLPEDAFEAGGGENAFGFVVLREHADFVAEGLYHFLLTRR
jgi:hypothetical protein